VRELPNGRNYHSPLGLFEFQELGVAEAYLAGDKLAVWDTGIGKTHLAMADAAMLFEDDLLDLILIVCESNKVDEWAADFHRFTALDALVYHGANRKKKLAKSSPHVLVTTYETAKTDLCTFVRPPGKRGMHLTDGPLMDYLRERRVMVVYDESTRLKHRSSALWKAHHYAVKELRKARGCRVLGLTATPYETTAENVYNQLLIINPGVLPKTIKEFEDYYTTGRDTYGRLQFRPQRLHEFFRMISPALMRKRKTDPDVIAQFPKQWEEPFSVALSGTHRDFYEVVEAMGEDIPQGLSGAFWTIRRMVAGYPESLILTVRNKTERGQEAALIARNIVDVVGEAGLRKIVPSKMPRLIEWLNMVVKQQGSKVVVFTYYGPTIAPLIARDLREAKFKVFEHHSPMTREQMAEAKVKFRESTEPCVLVSSDAGARGMNLPEAMYVFHYDLPTTFATYRQRSDRNHRIDSQLPSVTSMVCILHGTVEEDIAVTCMDRNAESDIVIGDSIDAHEDHVLAEERRVMLGINQKKRKNRGATA
jgi:SNF2 family DNA or RNA helicase